MADISLVIINDNAEEYCPGLFKSIANQETAVDLDLIFVDNCSDDGSIQKAEAFGIKKIFRFDTRVENRGMLYNKGADLSEGRYVVFVHSDIYFASDFFRLLNIALTEERVNDLTCFGEYYADTRFVENEKIGKKISESQFLYKQLFDEWPVDTVGLMECSEACFMVRKEIFGKIRFNEKTRDSFFEYFFLIDVIVNDGGQAFCNECNFTHYFIELHEKIKSYQHDYKLLEAYINKYYLIFSSDQNIAIRNLIQQNIHLNDQIILMNDQITELKNNFKIINDHIIDLYIQVDGLTKFTDLLRVKKRFRKFMNDIFTQDKA